MGRFKRRQIKYKGHLQDGREISGDWKISKHERLIDPIGRLKELIEEAGLKVKDIYIVDYIP